MYYPDEIVEEVRVQNDIVDVISQYVRLTKKGSSHFGLCPFHNEKSPSFSVSPDKQMYYCFGCGAGGNVFTFVMAYENYSFVEAVKSLADRVRISLPEADVSEDMRKEINYKQQLYEANRIAARYFYFQLNAEQGKTALNYLIDRKIDEEIRKKFGLGYANFFRDDLYKYLKNKGFSDDVLLAAGLLLEEKNAPGQYYDRFFNRVMFPIFDVHGRVIGFGGRVLGEGTPKYLNSPETKLFDKSRNLYGLNIARTARRNYIIIVEGYMDVISLHQAGFQNTVASLGTSLTKGQAQLLKRYTEEVILSYDSDGAGTSAALRAIPILKSAGLSVRVVQVPRYKDPDELIKNEGKEAYEALLSVAKPSFMFEVHALENKYDLEDPEYRTRFNKEIAQKLLELENEMERENYLDAIVKAYHIKKPAMESLISELGKNVGIVSQREETDFNTDQRLKKKQDAIITSQKNLLSFMITHKKIFYVIRGYISPQHFTDELLNKVALIIFALYEENEEIVPAVIVNKFIQLEDQNLVASIFNNHIPIENQLQLEKMINENVKILKSAYLDQMTRSQVDPRTLMQLIQEKKALQTLYISLKDL